MTEMAEQDEQILSNTFGFAQAIILNGDSKN